ncbi:hypothetical protein KR018_007138, partial [Drosophila ironensis]
HPDKSKIPDSAEKFLEIKLAYEILSDIDRRRIYDRYGVTDEDSHYLQKKYDYREYNRFSVDSNENIFGKNFIFDHGISFYHKLSVTTNYFEKTILPYSTQKVHIIMFYNDWCFRCIQVIGAFKKLIEVLKPLGVQFATINAVHEPTVFRKTGADEVPKLIVILDRHMFIYRDNSLAPQKIVEFIRKKLPHKIYQRIDNNNINDFLGGWRQDNRIRALLFEPRILTRLRYLITAFEFKERVAFGFVDTSSERSNDIISRFHINAKMDTLLLFNEDSQNYVASICMSDIPIKKLINVIDTNQFLALPRLSSQEMLEKVCPTEWNRPRKRLCVILITENKPSHDNARVALRHIALNSGFNLERVRFAYMFKERQFDFVDSISKGSFGNYFPQLVIIWRRDEKQVKYEWVFGAKNDLDINPLKNATINEIEYTIKRLLKSSEALNYEAIVKKLFNEHTEGILSKWILRLTYFIDYLSDHIEDEHFIAFSSLMGTILFMFAVGYILMYFVRAEEEKLKAQGLFVHSNENPHTSQISELKLYELRAEKYNGMVRLLKPGCRTIILITDYQSRKKLFPDFHKAVWPYRKARTLLFGHLLIEKGLSWYSELLRLSLCENKKLQVNPRNCVGTVIALNGHRKYFCMYHAKHPETVRGTKRILKITKHLLNKNDDPESGIFLETNFPEELKAEEKVLLEENLLNGFDEWLERLFDGRTHKYFINYWPDFLNK